MPKFNSSGLRNAAKLADAKTAHMKPKKHPKPKPMKMWEWAPVLCAAVLLACVAIPALHDLLENRKPATTVDYVEPPTIIPAKPHHTHTKDAAETARLNRQMLEQHNPQ